MRTLSSTESAIVERLYQNKVDHKLVSAYCTAVKTIILRKWNGIHPVDQNTKEVPIAPGTVLKIVMVSRFGDMGLTDDLTVDHGYHIRVEPDDDCITDIRLTPESQPQTKFDVMNL